jgi:hypothetical protein
MVDRVHGHTAGLGTYALPPVSASLANLGELMLLIAYLTDCGTTVDTNTPHLGAGKAESGKVTLLGHQLDAGTGAASHLSAATGLQLDVVQDRTNRDVP